MLNNRTWGKQSNVFFDVVNILTDRTVNYDTNGVQGLEVSRANGSEARVIQFDIPEGDADINIFFVNDIEGEDHAGFQFRSGPSLVFIEDAAPLETVAHEVGHSLGVRSSVSLGQPRTVEDEAESHSNYLGDLMYSEANGGLHVRRHDWNIANP